MYIVEQLLIGTVFGNKKKSLTKLRADTVNQMEKLSISLQKHFQGHKNFRLEWKCFIRLLKFSSFLQIF